MTGKNNELAASDNDMPEGMRAALRAELAYHDAIAARLEGQGNKDTYHHRRAAEIRKALGLEDKDDGKLD